MHISNDKNEYVKKKKEEEQDHFTLHYIHSCVERRKKNHFYTFSAEHENIRD